MNTIQSSEQCTRKMATMRNNSMLTARNNRAVKGFVNDIAITMTSFGRSTIQQAAKIGLRHLVHEAGFNDYTGKLVNSYQAAILTKGGIEERIAKQNQLGRTVMFDQTGSHVMRVNSKVPILMTSYGMDGTSSISHKQTSTRVTTTGKPMKGFRMHKRRDGGESPEIRRSHAINGKPEKTFSKGFGAITTRIRGIAPPISSGYWLVFDNGASNVTAANGKSLAQLVQEQGDRKHRVFPDYLNIDMFGIGQKELKRAIAARKRYRR